MLTPRRNDARRNREAILRAAEAAFADDSCAVPLHEIARRTGLGRATVYRHFPDRHALAVAVAAQNLEALRGVVSADEGERLSFRDLLHAVLSRQASMRPLGALMRELPARDQQHHAKTLIGVLTPPFRRAQAEGQLRPDLEPADLLLVLAMLNGALVEAIPVDGDRDAAVQRLITVILDGLFTTSPPNERRAGAPATPPRPQRRIPGGPAGDTSPLGPGVRDNRS
ncbi:MAG: TetR/AcrR family transcriptional regulator [Frankia sp.]